MNKQEKGRININIILATFSYFGCISLGYLFSALLFQLIGRPTGIISYFVSVIMGISLFSGVARLSTEIFRHTNTQRNTTLCGINF